MTTSITATTQNLPAVEDINADWSSKVDLITREICPTAKPDELALFLHKCRRSGLDPLLGEAFAVPRNSKIKGKDGKEVWISKIVFQPAEAGLAARAARHPDFAGVKSAVIYEKDQCTIDFDAGIVKHVANVATPRGAIKGAWAKVHRKGAETRVVVVNWSEYVQDNSMWKSKAATMIEKCARAAAWRTAFPVEFAGLYVPEELDSRGEPIGSLSDGSTYGSAGVEAPHTQTVADKIKAAAANARDPVRASSEVIDTQALKEVLRGLSPVITDDPPRITFGKNPQVIADMSVAQIDEALAFGAKRLAEGRDQRPPARWLGRLEFELILLREEQARRVAALAQVSEPESSAHSEEPAEPGAAG